ncbi:MAG TPA: hypothetical protein VLE96_02595 [Chlamydiales bacterium]|nr:hypothetical protein [Chlamydiales bacterium]
MSNPLKTLFFRKSLELFGITELPFLPTITPQNGDNSFLKCGKIA